MKKLFLTFVTLFALLSFKPAEATWCAYTAQGYGCQIADGVNVYYVVNPKVGSVQYTNGEVGVWATNSNGGWTLAAWMNPTAARSKCDWPTGVYRIAVPPTDPVFSNNLFWLANYASSYGIAWNWEYKKNYSTTYIPTCGW